MARDLYHVFGQLVIQETMKEEKFKLVIYNQTTQIITQWVLN